MFQSIPEIRTRLSSAISAKRKVLLSAKRFVEVILVSGGAMVAALGSVSENGVSFPPDRWQTIAISGAILSLLGAIFLVWTRDDEDHVSDALLALQQADADRMTLQDIHEEHEMYFRVILRLRSLYLTNITSRGLLERAVTDGFRDETKLIENIIITSRVDLRIALGFAIDHTWTIVVYRSEVNEADGYRYLRCIAHDRSIDCEITEARTWREGIGVAGMALARNDEVVAPDILDQAAVSLFGLNGDILRPEDRIRYRSMCAVPVQVGNSQKPWGVVLASCDEPGHFPSLDGDGESEMVVNNKEALRSFAGVIALAVAICEETSIISDTHGGSLS